jgi:hypothetical protein
MRATTLPSRPPVAAAGKLPTLSTPGPPTAYFRAPAHGQRPQDRGHYFERRDAGYDPYRRASRSRLVDMFAKKIEEVVDHSHAKVRADVLYDRLVAMAFAGDGPCAALWLRPRPHTGAHTGGRTGPGYPSPGSGCSTTGATVIELRQTYLFCAWLAWCRYRVIVPTWDRTLGTVPGCLDNTLRRLSGAPTYLLTDNERTLTSDRVAGVPVRGKMFLGGGSRRRLPNACS